MLIPDFQTVMLSLPKSCANEKAHTNRGAIDYSAEAAKKG
jgi:hypothetical protein